MDIEKVMDNVFEAMDKGVAGIFRAFENSKLYKKYEGADDPVEQMLDDAGKAVGNACGKISEKAEPAIKNIRTRTENAVYEPYRKAGEPYGPGPEGLKKWQAERYNSFLKKAEEKTAGAAAAAKVGFDRVRGAASRSYETYKTRRTEKVSAESDPVEKPEDLNQ